MGMSSLNIALSSPRRAPRVLAPLSAAFGLALCLCATANAGLGEGADSVQRDHLALHAVAHSVSSLSAYDVHHIDLEDGTQLREFVSHQGTVFGVAWSGRSKPDFSVLLAQHFADYSQALNAHRSLNHKVFTMSGNGLVMSIMKLQRGFSGAAYLPASLPAGVNVQDIR